MPETFGSGDNVYVDHEFINPIIKPKLYRKVDRLRDEGGAGVHQDGEWRHKHNGNNIIGTVADPETMRYQYEYDRDLDLKEQKERDDKAREDARKRR